MSSRLLEETVACFSNYLNNRSQCIRYEGLCSDIVIVHKSVPQGSVIGPLLFTIYVNNQGQNVSNANFNIHADDVVY